MNTPRDASATFLVRIGDEERDACIAALVEHHVRGRLSVEEFDRRQHAATDAVTEADLAALVADLPAHPVSYRRGQPVPRTRVRSGDKTSAWRKAAIWGGPPLVVTSTSAVVMFVTYEPLVGSPIFYGGLIGGAVGYASHWAVSILKRG